MPCSDCYRIDHPEYNGQWCACALCDYAMHSDFCPKGSDPCLGDACKGPVTDCPKYKFTYMPPQSPWSAGEDEEAKN